MAARGFADLVEPGFGEHGLDDAPIACASRTLDEAALLESVEETSDPRGGEEHLVGEVDAAHPPFVGPRQPQQHLVVAQREAVVCGQLRAETPRRSRVRPNERREGTSGSLLDQYLTTHFLWCKLFAYSIVAITKEYASVHPRRHHGQADP